MPIAIIAIVHIGIINGRERKPTKVFARVIDGPDVISIISSDSALTRLVENGIITFDI